MSVKYEILKKVVKAAGLKNEWAGKSAEEIIEQKKNQYIIPAMPPQASHSPAPS